MDVYKSKYDCCGCSVCQLVCPQNAIEMKEDSEGFLYPVIDGDKCVECYLCRESCAFQNREKSPVKPREGYPLLYGARHKNLSEVYTSRSGAFFSSLVDNVLDKKGVIYGVILQDNKRALYQKAETKEEAHRFKKSKYIQADPDGVFLQVRSDLRNKRWVLFSGTPCYVSSLYEFLQGEPQEKLLTCDVICHGVPSPMIWQEYLRYIESEYKDQVMTAEFRDKRFGWKSHYESFYLKKSKKVVVEHAFRKLFYDNLILRPSCHNCPFCNFRRPSDITLGDFYTSKEFKHKFFDDDIGISLILVNTPKGKDLFGQCEKDVDYFETTAEFCTQGHLVSPSEESAFRKKFWNNYRKYGISYVLEEYTDIRSTFLSKNYILKAINRLKGV